VDRPTLTRAAAALAVLAIACSPSPGGRSLRAAVSSGLSGFSRTLIAQEEAAASPRARAPLTILQINDVYSTLPIDGLGGLARVATFKQNLVASGRTPLLVLAGDFLSPSVASNTFKGEQMIAALNAAGLDLATLGNHEFDFGVDVLIQRMRESRWQWVVSNVVDTNTGQPIGGALPYLVRTFGTLKVGFLGLCLTTTEISLDKLTHVRRIDPIEAAATYLPVLAREGADVIVAITHLSFADDRALAQRFPQIDLIVGGHEHYPITATENRTLISKAGSDAKFVARIDVNRQPSGLVERFFELVPITGAIADDPRTAAVARSYEDRLGVELNTVVATSRVPLDADSTRMRASETNLGDLVADAMRINAKADISIINSGSIRGDRVFPAGPITRRTLVEIHPFGNVICKISLTGRLVLEALNSGVAKLPATAGQFPQVSGLTMRVTPSAPAGSRVSDVRIGGQPLDPARTYTVAIIDYMLSGGDQYTMLVDQPILIGPQAGDLIVSALESFISGRDIAPAIEARITIVR
jgi:5'-nucleotidase / UDP-sugar diphosphatase